MGAQAMFVARAPPVGFGDVHVGALADVFQHQAHLDHEERGVEDHEARQRDEQVAHAQVTGRERRRQHPVDGPRLAPELGHEPAQLGGNPRSGDDEHRQTQHPARKPHVAEVRHHEDASAILAAKVCKRLRYTGDRLRLIMFLVDHHLTFWRTATTKDISDPNTIADFAGAVRNIHAMEALHLFTFVDSNGTNNEAWNDWKASLMRQLHQSTKAFFGDRKSFQDQFNRPKEETKQRVIAKLPDSYREEVEGHFKVMPARYFRHRGSTSIARHVKLFHRFFKSIHRVTNEAMVPKLGWEARPDEGYSLLEVAGWNRHLLLSKVAGALAARNLNILSADLFTRSDDLVLNIFRICTATLNPVTSPREIERIEKMMQDEFGVDECMVNFDALIEKQATPSVTQAEPPNFDIPQRVIISNEEEPNSTVLNIQAQDRIGLLYEIFTILGNLNAEVLNARISTQAGAAIDRLSLVDFSDEKKITDPERLAKIEESIQKCLDSRPTVEVLK